MTAHPVCSRASCSSAPLRLTVAERSDEVRLGIARCLRRVCGRARTSVVPAGWLSDAARAVPMGGDAQSPARTWLWPSRWRRATWKPPSLPTWSSSGRWGWAASCEAPLMCAPEASIPPRPLTYPHCSVQPCRLWSLALHTLASGTGWAEAGRRLRFAPTVQMTTVHVFSSTMPSSRPRTR